LIQLTDFHETWYGHHATRDEPLLKFLISCLQ